MPTLEQRLTHSLEALVAERRGHSPMEALLKGRDALRAQGVPEAYKANIDRYFEVEHHAFEAVQKRMGITHADIMAHQMSLDMARDGDWAGAWGIMSRIYDGRMTRQRWEGFTRELLMSELRHDHQPIPV